MKNIENWKPSKFTYNRRGKLIASKNLKEVGAGSRLMGNLVAEFYDEALRVYSKGKLIDLGCGKIPLFAAYKNYITENICVDWSNTKHKNSFLDFECDLTQKLPFKSEEFDTIILSDVLEHIHNPKNLWQEMFRILSKDGILMLNVPFFYWLHERPFDFYRYTSFQLENFCNEFGFEIIKLDAIGGSPEVITDIISKHMKEVPYIGVPISLFLQSAVSRFIKTRIGNRISKKTSIVYPYGYFLIAKKT